jgi:hypothetical protein
MLSKKSDHYKKKQPGPGEITMFRAAGRSKAFTTNTTPSQNIVVGENGESRCPYARFESGIETDAGQRDAEDEHQAHGCKDHERQSGPP